VDFAAPFSPTSTWISPFVKVKIDCIHASTPGKVFTIPRHFDDLIILSQPAPSLLDLK